MLSDVVELSEAATDVRCAISGLSKSLKTLEGAFARFEPSKEDGNRLVVASEFTPIIEMMRLLSKTHETLAQEVESVLEKPILTVVDGIKSEGELNERQSKVELQALQSKLKKTERDFQKIVKAKDKKDLVTYQSAINGLNAITNEMKEVQARPMKIANAHAQLKLPFILNMCLVFSKKTQRNYTELNDKLKVLKLREPTESLETHTKKNEK